MQLIKIFPKSLISRFALAGAISVSALAIGSMSPTMNVAPAYAQPVTLNSPQVPGFANVVEAVSPAVVSVRVEAQVELATERRGRNEFRFDRRFFGDEDNPFFRRHNPQGENSHRHSRRERGEGHSRRKRGEGHRRFGMSQGSGFLVSDDGYIVTNNHVIDKGSKITVIMNDGTELEAKLIGSDKRSDLAVLKVEAEKKFTYVEFDDKNPRIGEWVVAVGNPFGLGGTVTAGIVSASGRQISSNRYDDFIQIDAAVNKGNSGGPTFNLFGKVVGVNTAIFSPSGGNVGIAFAIPASTASQIVEDLIDDGHVLRGWLGVQIQPVTLDIAKSIGLDSAKGAIVASAQPESPANDAGIKPGDVITAIDGKPIKGPRALARQIGKFAPDSDVTVTLWRDNASMDVKVKLGKLQDNASLNNVNPGSPKSTARIGLELGKSEDGHGVEIVSVQPGSRAEKHDIQAGDIILSINGEEVSELEKSLEIISEVKKQNRSVILFQIEREGNSRFVAIPLRKKG